ncbi:MAG: hypothetical protein GY773_15795 [Actinomycetia bacterium]|nr:hypothetical protein [Actinomycetes bacterium]
MADDQDEANPVEQLVELMVYAPIGLLYEYQEVLPKLVKRGKSQVQLARVFGQMAMRQSEGDGGGSAGDVTSLASSVIARVITDIGSQIGLAPPAASSSSTAASTVPESDTAGQGGAEDGTAQEGDAEHGGQLPIAGYDSLTARELIPLLDDLSADQRSRIRAHETANRNRKTVLAKLDRIGV